MKKTLAVIAAFSILSLQASACATDYDYSWAAAEIEYCRNNGIMTGDEYGNLHPEGTLTRAQMAKMLVEGFDLEYDRSASFTDVSPDLWYYDYSGAIKSCMIEPDNTFNGDEIVTREEFAATLVKAAGVGYSSPLNPKILEQNFSDYGEVTQKYRKPLSIAVEKAYFRGSDGYLRPKDTLKRAEVCALLYRVIESKKGTLTFTWEDLGVKESYTPILGDAKVSVDSAIAWAEAHDAAELFIDAAQYYWQYGEEFGIRPEVLYAQAAKETGFGKYGGAVLPEMNNFAGIKVRGATGDRTEDHETFATREDGVRGHFNHMCAYTGLATIGEVHERYYSTRTAAWAGTVQNVEALGGRWCPNLYYGYSIVHDLLENMYNY